jgi:hypothetical protein
MINSILDEYEPESDFAAAHNITQRTVARYRREADGLPFVEFGGRIYIHIPGAREWIAARVRHPNPRRAA